MYLLIKFGNIMTLSKNILAKVYIFLINPHKIVHVCLVHLSHSDVSLFLCCRMFCTVHLHMPVNICSFFSETTRIALAKIFA